MLWHRGKIASKLRRVCWRRRLVGEKGTRDNAANKSYGNGTSMILWCGQKSSGKEVRLAYIYALGLWTDQTVTGTGYSATPY
jgi:hypothetical protein